MALTNNKCYCLNIKGKDKLDRIAERIFLFLYDVFKGFIKLGPVKLFALYMFSSLFDNLTAYANFLVNSSRFMLIETNEAFIEFLINGNCLDFLHNEVVGYLSIIFLILIHYLCYRYWTKKEEYMCLAFAFSTFFVVLFVSYLRILAGFGNIFSAILGLLGL